MMGTPTADVPSIPIVKRTAIDHVEACRQRLIEISDTIWTYAEPSLYEYRSARLLCDVLRQAGFEVEEGIAGMPTAFVATWGAGSPTIGLMAEYDAIPGNSQRPVPYHSPIAPQAGGFPDLHNGIGTASVGAALAVKEAMNRHGITGTIRLFGTPAEKLCVGKPFLARDGWFSGLDAVVAWHPRAYTTCEWDSGPGCYKALVFTFKGVSAYGAIPWAGISALDAISIMNVIVQYMREHIPRQFMATINELVTIGGYHPTSLPEFGEVWYVFRSPVLEGIAHVEAVLTRAAQAAALATGAQVDTRVVAATRPWLPNHTMAWIGYRNLELVGPPRFSQEDKAFAREIFKNLGLPPPDEPFDEGLTPPDRGATSEFLGGADDVTEFCWHAPTVRIYVAYMLRPPKGVRIPNWANAALARTGVAHTAVITAAKAMACTVLELLTDSGELARAQEEFRQRTQGKPLPVQLPAGARPPVDLPLPSLVRGNPPTVGAIPG